MKSQQIVGILEIQVSFSEIFLGPYLDHPRNSEAGPCTEPQGLNFISFMIDLSLTISLIIFAL